MKTLTKAEERVMQILWKLENAFTKDIIALFEKNKPSYTTVATVLTILEQKGFVSHEKIGNSKKYSAIVSKESYSQFALNGMLGNYFEGSLSKLVSFFSEHKQLDMKELDEIIEVIKKQKKGQ